MKLNPYLFFNGDCEVAFKFYEQVLGGKIVVMMPYQGTPACDQVSAEWSQKILHARLILGDQVLMGSDAPPGRQQQPAGFSLSVQADDPAEAECIFQALSEGGHVHMPMEPTFFASRFGMAVDRFGIPWMVVCENAA